ncbi:MAG: protein translocase subunit SecF, partial [Gammaproteobacteria bacterium]|nr:protein translocase subunit SecF [Gammaproteobacteria bacterium]NIR97721.1 protein translocase subunit SecF [Gammaproteobacteria bacterium]NIT63437.1 protein translocase subunit SecF [Gammaproteobacteria bacterium]NIV20357.1 protein translocase subunit SecF [Gammaproteobacteria bacterium]NIX10883.1 protein translocase subunit SecF [Gammaproteobacteria bacterium]
EFLIILGGSATQTRLGGKSPAKRVEEVLKASYPSLQVRRVETVGPKVGEELKTAAFQA